MMTRLRSIRALPLLGVFMLPVAASAQDPQPRPRDVPYVPTPPSVVAAMLDVANVTHQDLVYDLGSGDGRIVIAAARDYGATGIGVDIDPQRVAEARVNARAAGVDGKVQFMERDLFETEIREATVLTLYLLPSVNLRLRPRILSELRPGTRVVSHAFDMDSWVPDEEMEVDGRRIYYWVVPAQVMGSWRWTLPAPDGERAYTVLLDQEFQKVTGSTRQPNDGSVSFQDARLVGDEITFTMVERRAGQTSRLVYTGRVAGNTITGRVEIDSGPLSGSHSWRATRATGMR